VKAAFPFEGGKEWMWVEVGTWEGDVLSRSLQTRRDAVKGLEAAFESKTDAPAIHACSPAGL
jgi:hypothetical protein